MSSHLPELKRTCKEEWAKVAPQKSPPEGFLLLEEVLQAAWTELSGLKSRRHLSVLIDAEIRLNFPDPAENC